MQLNFKKCGFSDLECLVNLNINNFSSPIDSYVEEHILNSNHFCIEVNGERIGYFSIHNKNLLTQYYLKVKYRNLAQEIFNKIKKMHNMQIALVPTCDEFFLSHAIDCYRKVENQAYLFQDSYNISENREIETDINLRLANNNDIEDIVKNSGDFFDHIKEQISKEEIYIAKKDRDVVGYGLNIDGVLAKEYASIGMYTIEKYRQQGIGTEILLELKKLIYSNNKIPIAGCWYYNHNSKKTLESAGFHSNTRLLKFHY